MGRILLGAALVVACRGDFDASDADAGQETTSDSDSDSGSESTTDESTTDGDESETGSDTDTSSDTTDEGESDTGHSDLIEECDGCWSGWCEVGTSRCALGVFVTNENYIGAEIGGIDAADMLCANQAGGPGQPFRAWLSTSMEAAPDHVNLLDGRLYVLKDGSLVATAEQDFVTGGLLHPIDQDAQGMPAPAPSGDMACPNQGAWMVWTGTGATGEALTANCNDWSGSNGNGQLGRVDLTVGGWTDHCSSMCTRKGALYCFQNPL